MLAKKLQSKFDAAVEKAGLTQHRDVLLADARECVHVHYGKPEKKLPLGASRVGGAPDMPASVEWPDGMQEGEPYGKAAFLAQLNLAELPVVKELGLPRKGHLWLFVRDNSDYEKLVSAIYRDGSEPLKPRRKPGGKAAAGSFGWNKLKMAPLSFTTGVSLPFSSREFRRKWREASLPHDALHDLQEALGGDLKSYGPRDGIDGQIGGYSFQAEIDLCREIAIERVGGAKYLKAQSWDSVADLEKQIERGLPFPGSIAANQKAYRNNLQKKRDGVTWIEQHRSEIAATAASIRLLCMFRPDSTIGLDFGEGMFLDFLIDESALAERDFSQIYCRLPMLL